MSNGALLKVLEDFPKLNEEYTRRINENYTYELMNIYSDVMLGYENVHIRMKNHKDVVTLFSSRSKLHKEEIHIYEGGYEVKNSSQGLDLCSAAIFDKAFKKSIIGGYKMEEVDAYLDRIIEDYRIFERYDIKNMNCEIRL